MKCVSVLFYLSFLATGTTCISGKLSILVTVSFIYAHVLYLIDEYWVLVWYTYMFVFKSRIIAQPLQKRSSIRLFLWNPQRGTLYHRFILADKYILNTAPYISSASSSVLINISLGNQDKHNYVNKNPHDISSVSHQVINLCVLKPISGNSSYICLSERNRLKCFQRLKKDRYSSWFNVQI